MPVTAKPPVMRRAVSGIALGVISSLLAAQLVSLAEGARLRPGRVTTRHAAGSDLHGLVDVTTSFRNTGVTPGGIRAVYAETIPAGTGLEVVSATPLGRKQALPFQRITHTTRLSLRRTGASLPVRMRLTYERGSLPRLLSREYWHATASR